MFTGYFGLSFSDALMQKLQICFLTKSPVAVTKQDWAPASALALLSCIFPSEFFLKFNPESSKMIKQLNSLIKKTLLLYLSQQL